MTKQPPTVVRAGALLAVAALALAACSSQPTMDRATVDRPEVQRPEGVEPEGLAEIRDTLASRRAESRERENALLLTPNALGTHSTVPWYETVLSPIADVMQFFRNF